jgi:adenine-specific DNA-methyltransferase
MHIVPNGDDDGVRKTMQRMAASLETLGITVSTGRVVDFRATELLRAEPEPETAPLIYPGHFDDGYITWPKLGGKKPNALALWNGSDELLIPAGYYVLVKRFSAKEETRRVVAAVYDPKRIDAERVGFENHLNYFHRDGGGLPESFAKGLAAYLNSSVVDACFRQFSGHTQVNATDLRSLRYPDESRLIELGKRIGARFPEQSELDRLIDEVVLNA